MRKFGENLKNQRSSVNFQDIRKPAQSRNADDEPKFANPTKFAKSDRNREPRQNRRGFLIVPSLTNAPSCGIIELEKIGGNLI